MDYWIVWGYTQDHGLWAAFGSREQAEERKLFWAAKHPKMKFSIYHEHEKSEGSSSQSFTGGKGAPCVA